MPRKRQHPTGRPGADTSEFFSAGYTPSTDTQADLPRPLKERGAKRLRRALSRLADSAVAVYFAVFRKNFDAMVCAIRVLKQNVDTAHELALEWKRRYE